MAKKPSNVKIEKEFEIIWASYPVKEGKTIARQYYKKLIVEGYSIKEIESAVFDYVGFVEDCNIIMVKGSKFFKDVIRNHLRKKESKLNVIGEIKPAKKVTKKKSKKKNVVKKANKPKEVKVEKTAVEKDNTLKNINDAYRRLQRRLKSCKYKDYLKTTHWKHFRKEALKHFDYTCKDCGLKSKSLHIHHLSYENRGRETFNDVVALCEDCHNEKHK